MGLDLRLVIGLSPPLRDNSGYVVVGAFAAKGIVDRAGGNPDAGLL